MYFINNEETCSDLKQSLDVSFVVWHLLKIPTSFAWLSLTYKLAQDSNVYKEYTRDFSVTKSNTSLFLYVIYD